MTDSTKVVKAAGRGEKVDRDELAKARKVFWRRLASAVIKKGGLRISASGKDGTIDLNEQVDQNRHERLKKIVDALDAAIGVLSLSAVDDSILLWSHYAQNHHGVCLEFDREKHGAEFPQLRAVRYGPMPELSAKFPAMVEKLWSLAPEVPQRLIIAAANVLAEGPPGEDLDAEFEEAMRSELRYLVEWFYTKFEHWDYEHEWRALAPRNGTVDFPPEALTGVIVGCAADDDTLDRVRSWVAKAKSPATISMAQRVDGKFELDIVPAN